MLAIAVAIFIFCNSAKTASVSSSVSGGVIAWINDTFGISLSQFVVRKTAHFCEFAALGGALYLFVSCFLHTEEKRFIYAVVIGGVYAATDELHQVFVPGRSGQVSDWLLDVCGVLFGIAVVMIMKMLPPKKSAK